MTFDEAMEVLGIGLAAGPKGARRAYLRLIKIHKPDRDPEAFRRVREAYESVKAEIEWRARFAGVEAQPSTPPAAEPAPPPPIEQAPPSPDPATPADEASAPPAGQPPPSHRPFPPNARIIERPPVEDIKVRAVPDPLRLDMHLDQPPRIRHHPAGTPFAFEETDHGGPVRVEPRSPAPQRLAPQAPEDPRSPAELLAAADDAAAAGRLADAERLAHAAYVRARQRPDRADPDPVAAIRVVLALFAARRVDAARGVHRDLDAWLVDTGAERRLMGGQVAARLALSRALAGLPRDTPPEPLRIIARGLLDDDLSGAFAALLAFARESPYTAGVAAAAFDRAPLLQGMFGPALKTDTGVVPPPLTLPPARGPNIWALLGIIAFGLLAVLALADGCPGPSPRRTYRPPISLSSIPYLPELDIPDLTRLDLQPRFGSGVEQLRTSLDRACDASSVLYVEGDCTTAKAIDAAAKAGRCAEANRLAITMEAAAGSDPRRTTTALMMAMAARLTCREAEGTSGPSPPDEADGG